MMAKTSTTKLLSNLSRIRTTPTNVRFFSTTENKRPVSPQEIQTQRSRALSLYRRLLRASSQMPTPNRQNYIANKTRAEYRKNMGLRDAEEIEFCLILADTNLDTVMVQAEHLSRLFNDPEYQNYN
jgi:hypothetical protein